MKAVRGGSFALVALVLVGGVGLQVLTAVAQTAAPSLAGIWRSGDASIRVVVNKAEVRAVFTEVGPNAKALGFKPGDLSFVATADGNYMHGEQVMRYGGSCHPTGRKVPMIARMTADGRSLAIHFYTIDVDRNCRDAGAYTVTETVWQRQAGR